MLRADSFPHIKPLLVSVLLVAALGCTELVHARRPVVDNVLPTVAVAQLPAEGRETYRLIHTGGPFPHSKDGVVFGNRERLLPKHERGYYLEYTVKTPNARDRGARRIVCGGAARVPDACFYTSDHYASFSRIVE